MPSITLLTSASSTCRPSSTFPTMSLTRTNITQISPCSSPIQPSSPSPPSCKSSSSSSSSSSHSSSSLSPSHSPSPPLDQVSLLLSLLSAYDRLGPYATKVKARLQVPLDLKATSTLPLSILDSAKVNEEELTIYNQIVSLGPRLSFSSNGRSHRDCGKGTGRLLISFIEHLKEIVTMTRKVFTKSSTTDPISALQYLEKSLHTEGIFIKQTDRSVIISIFKQKALIANGTSQREAAREMVSLLERLAGIESRDLKPREEPQEEPRPHSDKISPVPCPDPSPDPFCLLTPTSDDQHLVDCLTSVSPHLSSGEYSAILDYLVAHFPGTFQLTTAHLPNGEQTPQITLPNGALFNCTHPIRNDFTDRKAVVAYKLILYLNNKALRNRSSSPKGLKVPESSVHSPKLALVSKEADEETRQMAAALGRNSGSRSPSPLPPPPTTIKSLSDGRLLKRIQLLADYRSVISLYPETNQDRSQIFEKLMEKRASAYEMFTRPHVKGRFITTIRIPEVCHQDSIAGSEEQSRGDAIEKMFRFLENSAKLVDSFRLIYSPHKTDASIMETLARENPEMVRITRTRPSKTRHCTSINIFSTVTLGGISKGCREDSDLIAYTETVRYLKKWAQLGEAGPDSGPEMVKSPPGLPEVGREEDGPAEDWATSEVDSIYEVYSEAAGDPEYLGFPSSVDLEAPEALECPYQPKLSEKILKRIQLITDYRQFASPAATNLEILQRMMSHGVTQFESFTVPHLKEGKFKTSLLIKEIHQVEAISFGEEQSQGEARAKMASFIGSMVRLVDAFTHAHHQNTRVSLRKLLPALARDHSDILQIVQSSPRPGQFWTTVNIIGLVTFNGWLMDSREKSEQQAFTKAAEYLRKLAQLEVSAPERETERDREDAAADEPLLGRNPTMENSQLNSESLEPDPPPELVATGETKPPDKESRELSPVSMSSKTYHCEAKIAKRIQLIADYAAFARWDKTDCVILREMMERGLTRFTFSVEPHIKEGVFRGKAKIMDIHLLEAFAPSAAAAQADVFKKTATFVASLSKLVARFRSLEPQTRESPKGAIEVIEKLAKDFGDVCRINLSNPKAGEFIATVHLLGLAGFAGQPAESRERSLEVPCRRAVEYLRKVSQAEEKIPEETEKVPEFGRSGDEEPLKTSTESESNGASTPPEPDPTLELYQAPPGTLSSLSEPKSAHFLELLRRFFTIPLANRVNMYRVVEHLNGLGPLPLLTIIEESGELCPARDQVTVYRTTLRLRGDAQGDASPQGGLAFSGSALKKRESLGNASLKLLTYLNQLKKLLKVFRFVFSSEQSPVQLLAKLKSRFNCGLVRIEGNRVELAKIRTFNEETVEESARQMINYLEALSVEMFPFVLKIPTDQISQLAALIYAFDGVYSAEVDRLEILEEMREQGQEIGIFCNYILDLSTEEGPVPGDSEPPNEGKEAGEYRAIVCFDGLTYFEVHRAEQAEAKNEAERRSVDFLRSFSDLMISFKLECLSANQNLGIFCSLLSKHSAHLQVYHTVDRQGYLTTVELLGIFVFLGRGLSKQTSICLAAEKLILFLKSLESQINEKAKLLSDGRLQDEMFLKILVKRFHSVYESDNPTTLHALDRFHLKGVQIDATFSRDPDGEFRCLLVIGRHRQLEITGKSNTKLNAKREAAKNLFRFLKSTAAYASEAGRDGSLCGLDLRDHPDINCAPERKAGATSDDSVTEWDASSSSASGDGGLHPFPSSAGPENPLEPTNTEHFLDREVSKRVYEAVARLWNSLPLENRRCKVLAAFVLTSDRDPEDVRVLSVGTGSKIIFSDALTLTGKALHDSHAEIIARRALICLLYEHLIDLLENGLRDTPELILEQTPPGSPQSFRLKPHLHLHLYVTSPPCGASFQVLDDKLRVKKEALAGYYEMEETYISNLCKIHDGSAKSTFMACTDKVTMWNVCGLQGALLSVFLEPVYLYSVVVSDYFKYDTFTRAFFDRVDRQLFAGYLGDRAPGYRLNEHMVGFYRPTDHENWFDLTLPKRGTKCSSQSHNWYRPLDPTTGSTSIELVNSRKGTLYDAEDEPSRLSKFSLVQRYQALVGNQLIAPLKAASAASLTASRQVLSRNRGTYANLKEQSLEYQSAKWALVRTFEESGLGKWIHAYGGVNDMFPAE